MFELMFGRIKFSNWFFQISLSTKKFTKMTFTLSKSQYKAQASCKITTLMCIYIGIYILGVVVVSPLNY